MTELVLVTVLVLVSVCVWVVGGAVVVWMLV
jgi:hypothetical protein